MSEFQISIAAGNYSKFLKAAPNATSVVVSNLVPNTRYEARVTIVVHGGATITSDPAFAVTQDGGRSRVSTPLLVS